MEGLVLAGYTLGGWCAAANLGAFADPAPDASLGRLVGIEAGLDLEIELGTSKRTSFIGELSGVRFFFTDDPHQLLGTAGVKWTALPDLDLTIMGLWGFVDGSDRYGLLFGVSPKFHLF